MIYQLLRWAAALALRWYYREIEAAGLERMPRSDPVLLAGNHTNALVDALVIATVAPRPVRLTAKATLAEHPVLKLLMRAVGVVPLRRASDESKGAGAQRDPGRNVAAFHSILDALEERGAVLVFPEGRSHSEPQLATLRTGIARMALQARDERSIRGLSIVPVGLTFERKWEPRSGVLLCVGEPLEMDDWQGDVDALTAAVDARLREVTLNFQSAGEASSILGISRTLAGVYDVPRPLGAPHTPLAREFGIARRVHAVRVSMEHQSPRLRQRADELLARLARFQAELVDRDIPVNDVELDVGLLPALRFLVREAAILAVGGPVAVWGRVNHWIPLRVARALALRSSRHPDDPATHTIGAGFVLVLFGYAVQAGLVASLGGALWAGAYLVSLPVSATWDFRLRDRRRRAVRRIGAWLQLRKDSSLAARLREEAAWLRTEAVALEKATAVSAGARSDDGSS